MTETILIALIGVTGAVIGSISTIAVQLLSYHLKECAKTKHDKPKRDLLVQMLQSPKHQWRKLETLKHVIGADEETTKRLLLEVGARASEDGQSLWGLIKRNPLSECKE